jgi:cation transport ATPase
MQKSIFPSNSLLQTIFYTYIEPKNTLLDIEFQKDYSVTLLEKNDIVSVKKGMRLLFDGVVVKGSIK